MKNSLYLLLTLSFTAINGSLACSSPDQVKLKKPEKFLRFLSNEIFIRPFHFHKVFYCRVVSSKNKELYFDYPILDTLGTLKHIQENDKLESALKNIHQQTKDEKANIVQCLHQNQQDTYVFLPLSHIDLSRAKTLNLGSIRSTPILQDVNVTTLYRWNWNDEGKIVLSAVNAWKTNWLQIFILVVVASGIGYLRNLRSTSSPLLDGKQTSPLAGNHSS